MLALRVLQTSSKTDLGEIISSRGNVKQVIKIAFEAAYSKKDAINSAWK